jgi:hypothetical protein
VPLISGALFSCAGPVDIPLWHFAVKVHSQENLSGQCAVALTRADFELRKRKEFTKCLTRDGLPLRDSVTRRLIKVRFAIDFI